MPELEFRGKEFVRNHHLTVPFRPLLPDADKSIGDAGLDGNLIIHGDNLHALKALLPRYAGKVDCIFIDPPYNTGNEGWSYNDNVNSPLMKEWLSSNPINGEDLLRHDKWCCMMWPRLRLLWELLAETGSLWMTLDDNEIHHARTILDEVFGSQNAIATVIWHKVYSPKNTARHFSVDHDYVLAYAKQASNWRPELLERTEDMEARYSNTDNDPRGKWKSSDLTARNSYSKGKYTITGPTGKTFDSGTAFWRVSIDKLRKLDEDNRVWWGEDGTNMPALKRFQSEVLQGRVPQTIWSYGEVGHTQEAKQELVRIMGYGEADDVFITPKPTRLLERILELTVADDDGAIVLDSFAGSGTTAHAVLKLNEQDGGNRKFILVECEDKVIETTSERVRRVINGYPFTGTQRETLFEKKLTWTEVKKGDHLRAEVENTKALFGDRFDDVKIDVKDGTLRVVGERNVAKTAPGLGGAFTYCTLGNAIDLDKMLSGDSLPARAAMAEWLLYVAGAKLAEAPIPETEDAALREWYLGRDADICYWLVYKPDNQFLLSREAALTLDLARRLKQFDRQRKHLVFAPAKYVSRKLLLDEKLPVEYANIPFSLFRLERD